MQILYQKADGGFQGSRGAFAKTSEHQQLDSPVSKKAENYIDLAQ